MFTGIIRELGEIQSIESTSLKSVIEIKCSATLKDINIGDSIGVNGICLTVSSYTSSIFKADVMNETLSRTSLSTLKKGFLVNLESAMPLNGRFGGHIVTGHVDGTGTISSIIDDGNSKRITISANNKILNYIVEKGSITIDGISLTVASVTTLNFSISIIPHTLSSTNLQYKTVGDMVNLENDIICKYIEKFMSNERNQSSSNLTMDFIKKYDF
ncbi:MAG: riboflavin synthase [Clostridium sp.]